MTPSAALLERVCERLDRRLGLGARQAQQAWVRARLEHELARRLAEHHGSEAAVLDMFSRDDTALHALAELLRVGETRFYRDGESWQAMTRVLFPELSRRPRLLALSAGCSTGEEAWTLAMVLDRARPRGTYRVVGADRSAEAVAVARARVYPAVAARDLPADLAARYLSVDGNLATVNATLAERVAFVERDLLSGPPAGRWDLVLFRNVAIYLSDTAFARVVHQLMGALAPGGHLCVARSEVPRVRALGYVSRELAPGQVAFPEQGAAP